MKKLCILLVLALCLGLCACGSPEEKQPELLDVQITAGKLEAGMTVKDVFVEVTVDSKPVDCRVKLTGFVWDGYWEMEEDEPLAEGFSARVDVYYSLPKGYDVDQLQVLVDADGGQYDGTGSISFDDQGNVEAWSRIFYGTEPLPPETEPTQAQTQPTELTQPTEQTQPQHTHIWTELPGPSFIDCTLDRTKTFQCSCGETKTEDIPAPGHDLNEWSVSSATCTQYGSKSTTCKRCSAGFTIEVPATGHTWSEWVKKTGRVHSHTCSVCGEEEEADHNIPAGSVTCTDCGQDIIN